MGIQIQITSRNIELTEAIESEIQRKSDKLERVYSRITRCRVVVESPHRHRHQGKLYNVQIRISVPGAELVIKRNPHEDLYIAVRDSFNAARRKLEDYARRQRGDVKQREEVPSARISALFPEKGYGFITTRNHEEIYFHKNSVVNHKFSHLSLGMEVRFAEKTGDKGPQASTVTVI